MQRKIDEVNILGFRFNPMTESEVLDTIFHHISFRKRLILAHLNVHGMAMMFESRLMNSLLSLSETLTMVDGMPIIWIGRVLGININNSYRTTSLDFYDSLFKECSEKGYKVDYVGSTPEVFEEGIKIIRERFPNLDIDGKDGYFDIDNQSIDSKQYSIIQWLNKRQSDILIVGMGMPRQEEWIYKIQSLVPTLVLVPVGAYLEYQVGALSLPPRWLGRFGLEWLFRLITAPRRLAYRYIIEPFILLFKLLFNEHPQKKYWKNKSLQ
jgi:N-acetylglucosaminyldiphosphoundecaprenol N-acetyl-beta-D-mannosaminyltransferase